MKSHLLLSIVLFGWTYVYYHPQSTANEVDVQPVVEDEVKPAPEPVVKKVLEVQTASWCRPCKQMKKDKTLEELQSQGWEIKYVDDIKNSRGKRSFPSFRVRIGDKSKAWIGYSSKASLIKKVNDLYEQLK